MVLPFHKGALHTDAAFPSSSSGRGINRFFLPVVRSLIQCEFAATIVDLADVVAGFANFTDTSKLAEVYDSVLAVGERIDFSIQQAKVFNHRERLFGREVTDYTSLIKIQKVCGQTRQNRFLLAFTRVNLYCSPHGL